MSISASRARGPRFLPRLRHAAGWMLVGVLAACSRTDPPAAPGAKPVRTMAVVAGGGEVAHEFPAEVRARTESRLAFRVAGRVTQRPAELGMTVRAGQLLAQLDAQDLQQGQDAARAAVASAQANHELMAADLQRFRELREQGFISAAELDRRSLAAKAAQAQLDQARAQWAVQRNQTGYAALVAPAPGVVTGVDVEPGAVVAAGQPVLRLAFDGPRDAVFAVPEQMLPALRPLVGRPEALRVRLWNAPADQTATLRELAAAADPVTRTYQARAGLGALPVQLGQTATVLLPQGGPPGAARLPLSALTRQQDRTSVFVVDRATMTLRLVPVTVGGAEGNELLITSGLTPGQDVVIAGVHVLTAGEKVRLHDAGVAAPPAAPAR